MGNCPIGSPFNLGENFRKRFILKEGNSPKIDGENRQLSWI
jgi:hypothetical protein